MALIDEAVTTGARRAKACAEPEVSGRTLRRWTKGMRPGWILAIPKSLQVCRRAGSCRNWPIRDGISHLSPDSTACLTAQMGSSITVAGQAFGPAQTACHYKASGPCEVWTWDIIWLPGPVAGMFF